MPSEHGLPGQGRAATLRECDLKICELCGWINLESSTECFVCGWHGRFERDPAAVHAAVELALRTQGRLEVENRTEISFVQPPSFVAPSAANRFTHWIRAFVGRFKR